MTTTASLTSHQTRERRTAAAPSRADSLVTVVVASIIAVPACIAVALAAVAGGVPSSFTPIASPYLFIVVDVVLGIAAGATGWSLAGQRSTDPRRTLAKLVPAVLVASFVPDIVVGVTNVFPHTSTGGVAALMCMHVVVAAIAIPCYLRWLSPWRH